MIDYTELEKKVKYRSKFSLNDFFGKGRIRNLMYEYECMRNRKDEEIAKLKEVISAQAITIHELPKQILELQKKNAELEESKEFYRNWMLTEIEVYSKNQDKVMDALSSVFGRKG